jgi:hypothetical protein
MIKKLKAEDIVKILKLNDPDFSNLFQCEIGEWVQFLMQNVENENFFMMGYFKDEKLIGYLIAYFVPLPICKGVSALYSKTAGLTANKKSLDELKKWSKERGAISIDIITNNVKGHGIYGFKKKATMMTIKL